MKIKLSSDDRAAIDLLLDGTATAAGSQSFSTSSSTENVQAVRRVFQLIQTMPAVEPSPDLAMRTMARISQSTGQVITTPLAQIAAEGQQIRPA